jgi:hypothetical protein
MPHLLGFFAAETTLRGAEGVGRCYDTYPVRSVFTGQARHVVEIVTLVDTVSIAVYAAHHETDNTASRCGSLCRHLCRAI